MRNVLRFFGPAVVLVVSIIAGESAVSAGGPLSSSNSAFVQAVKTCSLNQTVPQVVCQVTTSSVPLLQGATIAYVSDPAIFSSPAPGRIDSDVDLTLAVAKGNGAAEGHCTFYFATGTGICHFSSGTGELAGFHAELSIGTVSQGTYSVIGKYWIARDDG